MNSTFSLLTICFHNAYFPSVCLPILYLFKLQFFLIQFIFRNCQVLGKTGNKINHKTVSPCNCYFQQLLWKGCIKHTRYKIKYCVANKIPCCLINLSKSVVGKISKVILGRINEKITSSVTVNQWKNTSAVLKWYNKISSKTHVNLYHLTLWVFIHPLHGYLYTKL